MEQKSGNFFELAGRIIKIRPHLPGRNKEFRRFCKSLLRRLNGANDKNAVLDVARDQIQLFGRSTPSKRDVALKFAASVIVDMLAQGWDISVTRSGIALHSPKTEGIDPQEVKQRIRAGHLLERDAQLRQKSVREFIANMEQKRLNRRSEWVSVFSLMRDGRELATRLERVTKRIAKKSQTKSLQSTISPYLQVVTSDAICAQTGFKLGDIWRYFRHTWVSTYKSLPGRGMAILVRDSAAKHHPIIGIAALGSSTAQQGLRDRWIGWDSEKFVTDLQARPSRRHAEWVLDSVQRLIRGIYVNDLLRKRVMNPKVLGKPTLPAIERLLKEARKAAAKHLRFPGAAGHKQVQKSADWRKQAETPLFRAKRARTLAALLQIRMDLAKAGLKKRNLSSLEKALESPMGRRAVRQLVRFVKAEHVGIDMMDIIICGAVAPYNALLGGKLVCLLLTSPEVVRFYRKRYEKHESVIASSMRGKAVKRRPNLVLLATTSLYGVGSSQYNRLRVPLETLTGNSASQIEFVNLGISRGYGSYHFSQSSVDYLETLLGRAGGGRKVNSIFGEGVNPLMRKLRDGLAVVGLPTDELLLHGNPRVVYGVALAKNFRDVLLGLTTRPSYLLPLKTPEKQTQKLVDFWRQRWLANRINRPDVMMDVAKHSLSYPIAHGARVILPLEDSRD